MESHAQSVEDNLVDSLSFKLRPGASYVTDRRSCSYFPQGGNDYAPNGVTVIKVNLTGDSWLGPSTVKLFMIVKNPSAANTLTPLVEGGWGMIRRVRVLCGGQVVEDLDGYARLREQFHMMKPAEKRVNDAIEGFGDKVALAAGASRTICMSLMSGLLSQEKYLPIRYANLQLECEIVGSASDAFSGAAVSFQISDVQVKADLVTLDNSLANEYSQQLLSDKALPIHFSTFTSSSQVLTSLDPSVNVSRALTRLKAVFVTLSNDSAARKEVNNFFHPMADAAGVYDSTREIEFEMQIGSKKPPEYPIRSVAETYYTLRKALGVHGINAQMDMTATSYSNDKFVLAIDTEKVLGASFSGYNSKAGDLLTLKLKKLGSNAALAAVGTTKLHYSLYYDSILNIRDNGCEILE